LSEPLVCPRCARTFALDERFCTNCGMPLTYAGTAGVDHPVTDAQERARKVKRQYTEGDLVRVAGGRNQAEAELIQGMLLEEGVPSMLRRSRGFDVPDMLAAGPRDVLVPASGADAAREVLLEAEMIQPQRDGSDAPSRLMLGVMAACIAVAIIAWIGTELLA
jgi:hypothetical protein